MINKDMANESYREPDTQRGDTGGNEGWGDRTKRLGLQEKSAVLANECPTLARFMKSLPA